MSPMTPPVALLTKSINMSSTDGEEGVGAVCSAKAGADKASHGANHTWAPCSSGEELRDQLRKDLISHKCFLFYEIKRGKSSFPAKQRNPSVAVQ